MLLVSSLRTLDPKEFPLCFLKKSFIASLYIFKFMIQFQFIFIQGLKLRSFLLSFLSFFFHFFIFLSFCLSAFCPLFFPSFLFAYAYLVVLASHVVKPIPFSLICFCTLLKREQRIGGANRCMI